MPAPFITIDPTSALIDVPRAIHLQGLVPNERVSVITPCAHAVFPTGAIELLCAHLARNERVPYFQRWPTLRVPGPDSRNCE